LVATHNWLGLDPRPLLDVFYLAHLGCGLVATIS